MPDLRPRVDDQELSPKAKRNLLITIAILFVAVVGFCLFLNKDTRIIGQDTPETLIMKPIQSATIGANGLVCVEMLPDRTFYDPTAEKGIEQHCTPIENAWVLVNKKPEVDGTVATIQLLHDAPNPYGRDHYTATKSILILVRTEKEREQYQDVLDAVQTRLFKERDVALTDLTQQSAN